MGDGDPGRDLRDLRAPVPPRHRWRDCGASADQALGRPRMSAALFQPIRLAGLELANRIVVSPMCQYSADDGCANEWHLTHLGMLANSGAAMVVVESTGVERHGRITHGCMGLYSDRNEAALNRVVDHCRRI